MNRDKEREVTIFIVSLSKCKTTNKLKMCRPELVTKGATCLRILKWNVPEGTGRQKRAQSLDAGTSNSKTQLWRAITADYLSGNKEIRNKVRQIFP
jgi:6-phosphogluconate dehydrogenase